VNVRQAAGMVICALGPYVFPLAAEVRRLARPRAAHTQFARQHALMAVRTACGTIS